MFEFYHLPKGEVQLAVMMDRTPTAKGKYINLLFVKMQKSTGISSLTFPILFRPENHKAASFLPPMKSDTIKGKGCIGRIKPLAN